MGKTEILAALIAAIPTLAAVLAGIAKQSRAERKMRLSTLKLLIVSEGLPLRERLEAYEEYRKIGGNHWMTEYYERRLKPAIHADIARLEGGGNG
jgi:uncharacterized membrane-anchored protein